MASGGGKKWQVVGAKKGKWWGQKGQVVGEKNGKCDYASACSKSIGRSIVLQRERVSVTT